MASANTQSGKQEDNETAKAMSLAQLWLLLTYKVTTISGQQEF
jgi:hypothetical protein